MSIQFVGTEYNSALTVWNAYGAYTYNQQNSSGGLKW